MLCILCNLEKDNSEFTWRNKKLNILNHRCKLCSKVYYKNYYENNKIKYMDRAERYKRKMSAINYTYVTNIKLTIGCQLCSEKEPCCLDFHHINNDDKSFSISERCRINTWEILFEEIKKCILVCSNCHRKIHFDRVDISSLSTPDYESIVNKSRLKDSHLDSDGV